MKRVLICGMTGNYGGVETYIMNIYRRIDKSKVQFDFLSYECVAESFKKEIEEMGGQIFVIPKKRKNIYSFYKILNRVFDFPYSAIYYQANRRLKTLSVFKIAKRKGVKVRILHSHNSEEPFEGFISKLRKDYVSTQMDKYVTLFFACSENAGEWMYDKRPFTVINNGVDIDIFKYNLSRRADVRKELNICDKVVVGTVGRMADVKNPMFMLDVFYKYHMKDKNSVFLYLGDGELKDEIKKKIKKLQLDDSIIMTGNVENVYDYFQAMDVMILPSKHEGFPIVLVEAQTSGLPCFVADNITRSVNLTGDVSFLPIDKGADIWVNSIMEHSEIDRDNAYIKVKDAGYDVNDTAIFFEELFLK